VSISLKSGLADRTVAPAAPFPYANRKTQVEQAAMDDAADVNKVVAAIFAAGMCSAKENKHANYLAEYESFLTLLEARDTRARAEAKEGRTDFFTQIGGKNA
jgi:hypothetical protein